MGMPGGRSLEHGDVCEVKSNKSLYVRFVGMSTFGTRQAAIVEKITEELQDMKSVVLTYHQLDDLRYIPM